MVYNHNIMTFKKSGKIRASRCHHKDVIYSDFNLQDTYLPDIWAGKVYYYGHRYIGPRKYIGLRKCGIH